MSRRGRKNDGPRSDDERQRARLEREQRRAQREGRPVPQDLDELAAAARATEPESVGDVVSSTEGSPTEEPPTDEPAAGPTPTPAPGADHPPPAPSEAAPWWSSGAAAGQRVDVADALDPPSPSPVDPPVVPSSPAARSPAPGPPPRQPPPSGADDYELAEDEPLPPLRPSAAAIPPIAVVPRKAPSRRGWSRIAAVLVLLPIVLLAVVAILLFQPFKGDPGAGVRVTIPAGSSVTQIGDLLAKKGVVDSGFIFAIRARLAGGGADLRAGATELNEGMSYGAALDALRRPPLPDPVVQVTVPEGLSRREVASHVKSVVSGDYLRASRSSSTFDPKRYGQPKRQGGLEGFLFPDTYELPRGGATAKALVAKQVATFTEQLATIDMSRARRAKRSAYDVLIVASMIEREVSVPSERRRVAAVIYNRLEKGMTLGIDATIRYAEQNWSRPLRVSELQRDGPFNTRTRKGLPPTPIGNPGRASIVAAANPSRESSLYYVIKPCGNGRHAFSSDDAQFERDRQAYEQARTNAGGDPSACDGGKR